MIRAASLALVLAAATASARCKEPLPPICGEFERATRAAATDPLRVKAEVVWKRVSGPFVALSGRTTSLAVLSREARYGPDGKPFPPVAYVCAGSPPVVYLPHTLLERVYESGKYPEDFLAFVLGHELGHRASDLRRDGCPLDAFGGGASAREEHADGRSAFLTAIAGYSTRRIAAEDLVTTFLASELSVRGPSTDRRRAALTAALGGFDAWEQLYRTAADLALAGELDMAQRLLGWADALMRAQSVPLPEIVVARALVLLSEAAPWAPWLSRMNLPASAAHLRCLPVTPAHSALWDKSPPRKPRGPGSLDLAARTWLSEARRLLVQARALGASRLVTATAEGCAALYLGEGSAAREAFQDARRLAGASLAPAARDALDANVALVELLAWTDAHPAPPRPDAAWTGALLAAAPGFSKHEDVSALVDALAHPLRPKTRAPMPALGRRPALPEWPSRSPVGACPDGFAEDARLADSTGMLVSCAAPDGRRFTRIRLPDAPPAAVLSTPLASTVQAFAEGGCRVERVGATDLGDDALSVTCRPAKPVLVRAREGVVREVVGVRLGR